jgi:hypothetical protein
LEDGGGFLAVGACSVDVGFGGDPCLFVAMAKVPFGRPFPFLLQDEVRRDNPAALASAAVFGGFTIGATAMASSARFARVGQFRFTKVSATRASNSRTR